MITTVVVGAGLAALVFLAVRGRMRALQTLHRDDVACEAASRRRKPR